MSGALSETGGGLTTLVSPLECRIMMETSPSSPDQSASGRSRRQFKYYTVNLPQEPRLQISYVTQHSIEPVVHTVVGKAVCQPTEHSIHSRTNNFHCAIIRQKDQSLIKSTTKDDRRRPVMFNATAKAWQSLAEHSTTTFTHP